ncbi:MAG: energy coupling factor transporter S component ThiW [Clostridia bacterium]|nr:energy coupling factor transporter S component ThiW [Clostridia bacterium]
MNRNKTLRLALSGVLCAVAVVGSTMSFPVLSSKCAPVQHMVNVLAGVTLGPWYALGMAFAASLIRNLLGLGSLLAFPGSMCGALLCGLAYAKTRKTHWTVLGEIAGTGIVGGLLAYPIAVAFMGVDAGAVAFYAYVVPFLVSTVVGACISGVIIAYMQRSGLLKKL